MHLQGLFPLMICQPGHQHTSGCPCLTFKWLPFLKIKSVWTLPFRFFPSPNFWLNWRQDEGPVDPWPDSLTQNTSGKEEQSDLWSQPHLTSPYLPHPLPSSFCCPELPAFLCPLTAPWFLIPFILLYLSAQSLPLSQSCCLIFLHHFPSSMHMLHFFFTTSSWLARRLWLHFFHTHTHTPFAELDFSETPADVSQISAKSKVQIYIAWVWHGISNQSMFPWAIKFI